MPDEVRVMEVWAPGSPKGMVGSGYLVGEHLVLTAGHVVDVAERGACEVRPLNGDRWLPAERVWRGQADCDAALLRIAEPNVVLEAKPAQLGRVLGTEPVPVGAVGFPAAQARPDDTRESEQFAGKVMPLSARKSGRMTIAIDGSVPQAIDLARPEGPAAQSLEASVPSAWAGMSGAAVFCRGVLIGVVNVAPEHFGTDRLEAVALTAIVGDGAFQAELAATHGSISLRAVEAYGLLHDPNRSLDRRSAGQLLDARSQAVPFRGRTRELRELIAWCASGTGLQVSLLLGISGAGKTRLAAELCDLRHGAGAIAGFLAGKPNLDRLPGALSAAELVIVVDEAHSRHDAVAGLLRGMQEVEASARVRVLLVARNAGDWTTRLADELEHDGDAGDAVRNPRRLDLGPVDRWSRDERAAAWRAALRTFAAAGSSQDLTPPNLSGPAFDTILWVHVAALSAADPETATLGDSIARADLTNYVLERERRYWTSTAALGNLAIDVDVLEVAVAVATIAGAATREDAVAVLEAVPDLDDAYRRRAVARWLNELYPLAPAEVSGSDVATRWLPALGPQPLGEALIAKVLADAPELAAALLQRATPDQLHATLSALTQAARSHPAVRTCLTRTISDRLRHVWEPGLTVAQRVGDPLGPILAETLASRPDPVLARAIERALPERTVTLRDLAVVATGQTIEHLREQPADPDRDAQLARLLSRQATRLSLLGLHQPALAAIDESIDIRRRRAAATSDLGLAASLTTRSVILGELDRLADALAAIEEAMESYGAHGGDPSTLAAPLNTLATILSKLGRPEDALLAITEAVEIHRMPGASPADLAVAVDTQSTILSKLYGHKPDALAAIEEAVEIRRELVRTQWDAFRPDLARSLLNLSSRLSDLDRHFDALGHAEEAVEIFRELAAARREAFVPDLARALSNYAICLDRVGRTPDAVTRSKEAVALLRALEDDSPRAFTFVLDRAVDLEMELVMQQGIDRDLQREDVYSQIDIHEAEAPHTVQPAAVPPQPPETDLPPLHFDDPRA